MSIETLIPLVRKSLKLLMEFFEGDIQGIVLAGLGLFFTVIIIAAGGTGTVMANQKDILDSYKPEEMEKVRQTYCKIFLFIHIVFIVCKLSILPFSLVESIDISLLIFSSIGFFGYSFGIAIGPRSLWFMVLLVYFIWTVFHVIAFLFFDMIPPYRMPIDLEDIKFHYFLASLFLLYGTVRFLFNYTGKTKVYGYSGLRFFRTEDMEKFINDLNSGKTITLDNHTEFIRLREYMVNRGIDLSIYEANDNWMKLATEERC